MADLLALLAIIVTVLIGLGAIAVTIWLDRKRHPKREFAYSVQAAPLVSSGAKGLEGLTVSYQGEQIDRPYLVNLEISSRGRADISSSSFDAGKPVRIDLQVPILAEIDQRATLQTVDARLELVDESLIELAPSLLPKGMTLRASYICEGKPSPKYKIPLPDITIREGQANTFLGYFASDQPHWAATGALVSVVSFLVSVLIFVFSPSLHP